MITDGKDNYDTFKFFFVFDRAYKKELKNIKEKITQPFTKTTQTKKEHEGRRKSKGGRKERRSVGDKKKKTGKKDGGGGGGDDEPLGGGCGKMAGRRGRKK